MEIRRLTLRLEALKLEKVEKSVKTVGGKKKEEE